MNRINKKLIIEKDLFVNIHCHDFSYLYTQLEDYPCALCFPNGVLLPLYTVPNKGQGYIYCYRDVFYELVREWEDCNSVAGWNIEEHMGDRIRCSNSVM